ncbi:hypothetical protein FB475_4602 [Kribbella jejuensis]|uniref:Uncharacterized protein n=1 Tax=Kribbella jejuensis TaxID=236068 RepID=A0A542E8M0_9ACTN|nr:hypothetical protein FB475_4602 [Kribbella jejuensis]
MVTAFLITLTTSVIQDGKPLPLIWEISLPHKV